jgi:hypothetical protein
MPSKSATLNPFICDDKTFGLAVPVDAITAALEPSDVQELISTPVRFNVAEFVIVCSKNC